MGQTLTHGVYLPDEGERNCYDGLAANWQLLDGAVGTVADHTAQIAGKAPAVHTHTKSDVTDLFNSANTWSALNSYSNGQIRIKSQNQEIGVIPSSGVIQYLEFADKNDAQHGIVGLWDYAGGASEIQMYISDKFKNGTKDPTGTSDSTFLSFGFKADGSKFLAFSGQVDNSVIPKSNNIYDLGSSSYQWNNVYAKGYYYNGTPWGLDKLNRWSQSQELRLAALDDYTLPSSEVATEIFTWWGTNNFRGGFGHQYYTNGDEGCRFLLSSKDANNTDHLSAFRFKLNRVGTDSYFYGTGAQNFHLGTSTNKWKSFNGINPGALSLPTTDTSKIDYFNGDITDKTGGANNKTFAVDGWITVIIPNVSGDFIAIDNSIGQTVSISGTGVGHSSIDISCPVRAGVQVTILCKCSGGSVIAAHTWCQGNV